MKDGLSETIFIFILIFCRIGACLMFAPGLSSPRVSMPVRLIMAVAITAALSPLIWPEILAVATATDQADRPFLLLSEILAGSAIGIMARCFILALQFAATAAANLIGLAGIPGIPLEDTDTGSPLASLASVAAVMLIMHVGLHIELLEAIIESYHALPPSRDIPIDGYFRSLLGTIAEAWRLALQLSAPFIAYAIIVNFALGLANRFAQQISIYHATTGAVILGGFMLASLVWIDWLFIFLESYRYWLQNGGF
jgi:flagellar biosynthetic protein FliR